MFWGFKIYKGRLTMRIMYFGFEGFDNSNGNNHLIIKMIDYFLEKDLEVYYLSSHTTGDYPDIPDLLNDREGFFYDIVYRNPVNKKKFISRYLNGVKYAFKAMRFWYKEKNNIDMVLLQSRPTAIVSAILLKIFLRKPLIFNYYDIFPNGPYQYGAIKDGVVYRILKLLQKILYAISDKILVISEDTRKTLIDEGVPIEKMVIIRNWYNENQIKSVTLEKNKFVKKFNIDTNKFILQYAGNFGYTFNYKKIIEIASKLKNYTDIEFHMIGTGTFENDFRDEVKKENLDNIKFFPWQSLDIISDVYSYCDIELIPLSKGVIWTSYPSKCSLLMACGKPFICVIEKESYFYKNVNKRKIGICTSINDIEETVNRILKIYNDKSILKEISENAIKYGNEEYSSEKNLKELLRIIKNFGGIENESI